MDDQTPKQQPKSLWPVFFWSLVALALFLVVNQLLLTVTGPVPEEDAARSAERTEAYVTLQKENEDLLSTYGWVKREKGSVRIPIDRAMEITSAKLAQITPHPAPSPQEPAEPVTTESVPDQEAAASPSPAQPNETALEIIEEKEKESGLVEPTPEFP